MSCRLPSLSSSNYFEIQVKSRYETSCAGKEGDGFFTLAQALENGVMRKELLFDNPAF